MNPSVLVCSDEYVTYTQCCMMRNSHTVSKESVYLECIFACIGHREDVVKIPGNHPCAFVKFASGGPVM